MPKTICLDFDGVLHQYTTPWQSPEVIPNPPTPGAREFLLGLLADGWQVYIQSVRAADENGELAIVKWLLANVFWLADRLPQNVVVVSEKPRAWIYMDDRAWCFRGVFPTIDELKRFTPWNRNRDTPNEEYKPMLIATVGLPRSGKTTWAKGTGYPVVNPDSIRLALHGNAFIGLAEPFVWAIAKCMVWALFLAGHDVVVLDATNTTQKRRAEWVSKSWDTAWHVIPTSPQTCIERAKLGGRDDLVPVIDRMASEWDLPLSGQDQVICRTVARVPDDYTGPLPNNT